MATKDPLIGREARINIDATTLKGKTVVVYESLEHEGVEIAVHADIEDEGQTVTFLDPKIGTSAAGPDGEKVLGVCSEVTLVDTVSYENLIPGASYTLRGVLMDKGTGKPLRVDSKQVVAETTFTPDAASGTVEVVFTFPSAGLKGKTVVVFETLVAGEVTREHDTDTGARPGRLLRGPQSA